MLVQLFRCGLDRGPELAGWLAGWLRRGGRCHRLVRCGWPVMVACVCVYVCACMKGVLMDDGGRSLESLSSLLSLSLGRGHSSPEADAVGTAAAVVETRRDADHAHGGDVVRAGGLDGASTAHATQDLHRDDG
jgi:hypothetical protein